MHISKIIDYVKNEIRFSQEFCENNAFVTLRIEPILKIIENLEQSHKDILEFTKEIEQKDNQIDLMAEMIDELSEYYTRYHGKNNEFCKEICIEKDIDCKDCIKQYFAGLVKKDKRKQ